MTAIGNITRRGYTDHTTLDNLALVHMNGRVYDPAIGRFLSADPYVQFPLSAQSYNRYSYVLNNPLSFTDPSGYFLSGLKKFVKKYWKPIVAIAAAVVTYGAATGWIATAAGNSAYAAALAVPGATAGTASLYGATAYTAAAGAWSTAAIAGAAAGAVSGAIVGGTKGAVVGGFSGLMFGGIAGHFGNTWNMQRAAASGIAGGLSSEVSGGSFGKGFVTGIGLSIAQWATVRMRDVERAASRRNPLNSGGPSSGWIGDGADPEKLAGARSIFGQTRMQDVFSAPFGGRQGDTGSFFGVSYSPNGAIDHLLESFAGPHDWMLRNYAAVDGSTRVMGFWGNAALNFQATVTLAPAAAFVGAQVSPGLAFTTSRD
ncbi:MAG: RHS repeat-associated core domain-containing protein [Pirellulales bacterium]